MTTPPKLFFNHKQQLSYLARCGEQNWHAACVRERASGRFLRPLEPPKRRFDPGPSLPGFESGLVRCGVSISLPPRLLVPGQPSLFFPLASSYPPWAASLHVSRPWKREGRDPSGPRPSLFRPELRAAATGDRPGAGALRQRGLSPCRSPRPQALRLRRPRVRQPRPARPAPPLPRGLPRPGPRRRRAGRGHRA